MASPNSGSEQVRILQEPSFPEDRGQIRQIQDLSDRLSDRNAVAR
jgi:hypothetical protein